MTIMARKKRANITPKGRNTRQPSSQPSKTSEAVSGSSRRESRPTQKDRDKDRQEDGFTKAKQGSNDHNTRIFKEGRRASRLQCHCLLWFFRFLKHVCIPTDRPARSFVRPSVRPSVRWPSPPVPYVPITPSLESTFLVGGERGCVGVGRCRCGGGGRKGVCREEGRSDCLRGEKGDC